MKEPIPYPRTCPACATRTVLPATIHHVAKIKYEGKIYTVEIPDLKVGQCLCGEVVFDLETDAQIDAAFRRVVKLLTADQIHTGRIQLKLKQGELASALDVAKATISRWETRALIQSRAMDKFLRAYLHDPNFRELMRQIDADSTIGTQAVIGEAHPSDAQILGV
jgi:putative zinc finger/helix-turn-helix YgiT family protein